MNGKTWTVLECSKTWVAPIKTVTLPRPELCAAHLGVNLCKAGKTYAWTNSTTVLQWLAQLPKTCTTFLVNRVSDIQQFIPREQWLLVPTIDNPADLTSRGMMENELVQSTLGWKGPWLSLDLYNWPKQHRITENPPEKKPNKVSENDMNTCCHTALTTSANEGESFFMDTCIRFWSYKFIAVITTLMTAKIFKPWNWPKQYQQSSHTGKRQVFHCERDSDSCIPKGFRSSSKWWADWKNAADWWISAHSSMQSLELFA